MTCRHSGTTTLILLFSTALVTPSIGAERPSASVAHIKISGSLEEKPGDMDPFFGSLSENLKTKLDRIKKAKDDPAIQGLLLELDGIGGRWGKLNELRQGIAGFRKTGKKAFAYLENGTALDYLLAAACDEICMPAQGWLMLTGMRAEVSFYKDMFAKIGLKADMLQMGDYKGAAEPFTRSSMSKQFRERLESVLDDHFENDLIANISASRPAKMLTNEQVRKLIDQGPFSAKAAVAVGLTDKVGYLDDFQNSFKDKLQAKRVKIVHNYAKKKAEDLDFGNPFALLSKLFAPPKSTSSSKAKIAVIYATGAIVSGKSGDGFLDGETMGSTTMVETIRKAEKDDTVKAIVLRVDSPGGSALASDLIWNELVKSKKPVVASMSDVAASGGYYISMAAAKIYAEPGTLTGSIGVVGGKLVMGGLYDLIGLKTETITRGANAGVFSSSTPFSDSERKAIHALMQDAYEQFVTKAIKGREKAGKKFTRADFLKFAEGRIWTGRQAKANGLVDELGTLDDAVAAAKQMSGFAKDADIELQILPKAKSFMDILMERNAESRITPMKSHGKVLLPDLAGMGTKLQSIEALLRMSGDPIWAILPYGIDIR